MQDTPSAQFKKKIVYGSNRHIIPTEIVKKRLGIPSFRSIFEQQHLIHLYPHLQNITHHLRQHQMMLILNPLGRPAVQIERFVNLYHQFQHQIIPQLDVKPFYLGIDRTFMNQIREGVEVVVEYEQKCSLKWTKLTPNNVEFIKLYKYQELIVIGKSMVDSQEFSGIKVHSKVDEHYMAIEMGTWKHNFPIINLTIKYDFEQSRQNPSKKLYYREFQNKKLKEGEIRHIEGNEILRYQEVPSSRQQQ